MPAEETRVLGRLQQSKEEVQDSEDGYPSHCSASAVDRCCSDLASMMGGSAIRRDNSHNEPPIVVVAICSSGLFLEGMLQCAESNLLAARSLLSRLRNPARAYSDRLESHLSQEDGTGRKYGRFCSRWMKEYVGRSGLPWTKTQVAAFFPNSRPSNFNESFCINLL
jgi:hypothetical protein